MLANLVDEVKQTNIILINANRDPKKSGQAPKFVPVKRPTSVYAKLAAKARTDARLERHDNLVRRLLGSRAKK